MNLKVSYDLYNSLKYYEPNILSYYNERVKDGCPNSLIKLDDNKRKGVGLLPQIKKN